MSSVVFNYGFWDLWDLYHKVTFDGVNRLILVNEEVTELNVQAELYSEWKEWVRLRDHGKFTPAFSVVGGDPITSDRSLGNTFFLENGWRIKPYEGEYVLTIEGNLYTREPGQNPAVPTSGVSVNLVRSNITETAIAGGDRTETRLKEIWQILGLDNLNPQTITNNSIRVGNLTLTIENPDDNTTTVTRSTD